MVYVYHETDVSYLWREYFILLSFIFKTTFLLLLSLFFLGCNEKPRVLIKPELVIPIECITLDTLGVEQEFIETLNKLYTFNKDCSLVLKISYKKDIVCNSGYNAQNMSKKPKSYLQLQLREGLEVKYSYYLDLYSNVDSTDVTDAFERLEEDLIKAERKE